MTELQELKEKEKLSAQYLKNLKEIEKIRKSQNIGKDWETVYRTLLDNEELTIKQIMLVTGYGNDRATAVRDDIRKHQIKIGEELESEQIPTELLLKYLGKSMNYYKQKCYEQLKIAELKGVING